MSGSRVEWVLVNQQCNLSFIFHSEHNKGLQLNENSRLKLPLFLNYITNQKQMGSVTLLPEPC